jgi:large subunit ribosomal protein L21
VYAVVRLAGKQFTVRPNEIIDVPRLKAEPGSLIRCDEVLVYSDGKDIRMGRPLLDGINVVGEVVNHGREPKILIYKMKRRKNYRRKQGHHQGYTRVRITEISAQKASGS